MDKQLQQRIEWCYKHRYTVKEIAMETGCNSNEIKSWLRKQPYFIRFWNTGKHGNLFYFENVMTEEQAYWLGFIYADGYIMSNGTLGIELNSEDFSHIEKFRQALQAESEVKIYNKNSTFGPQQTARFIITSKATFIPHLLKYYVSLNKTEEGKFPILPDHLMNHCIRGFFDGDGSLVGAPKTNDQLWKPQISFTGRKETLQAIVDLSGFEWSWSQRHPERINDNWQINIGRVNDSLAFLDYMYDGATIYLDRKYKKYQDLLQNRHHLKAKARV